MNQDVGDFSPADTGALTHTAGWMTTCLEKPPSNIPKGWLLWDVTQQGATVYRSVTIETKRYPAELCDASDWIIRASMTSMSTSS